MSQGGNVSTLVFFTFKPDRELRCYVIGKPPKITKKWKEDLPVRPRSL